MELAQILTTKIKQLQRFCHREKRGRREWKTTATDWGGGKKIFLVWICAGERKKQDFLKMFINNLRGASPFIIGMLCFVDRL